MHVRSKDQVVVISGKDKGKKGRSPLPTPRPARLWWKA